MNGADVAATAICSGAFVLAVSIICYCCYRVMRNV